MANKITYNGQEYAGSIVNDSGVGEYTTNDKKKNPTGNNAEIFNSYGGSEQRWDGTIIEYRNIATGEYSHAEGFRTTASGDHSHAEGSQSIASNHDAHAEGCSTASGAYSHAEGSSTTASGDSGSHAEGTGTLASGPAAHAEGTDTQATAVDAHAEGCQTIASGYYTHTEGVNTKATDTASHAEGEGSWAGNREGYNCVATHAEGKDTRAWATYAHAEGWGSQALATTSHAEGYQTIASGAYAHSEGWETEAYGAAAHSSGHYTLAKGANSIAVGENTVASCQNQIALGKFNALDEYGDGYANNKYVVMVGNGYQSSTGHYEYEGNQINTYKSSTQYTVGDIIAGNLSGVGKGMCVCQCIKDVQGVAPQQDYTGSKQYWNILEEDITKVYPVYRKNITTLDWTGALVCGTDNDTTLTSGAVFGNNHSGSNSNYSYIEGNTNNVSGGTTNHCEGYNNTLSYCSYTHVEGQSQAGAGTTNCHIEGYHHTTGGNQHCHIEGYEHQAGGGNHSHIEGYQNSLGGVSYSHIEGYQNNPNGSSYCHVEGYKNVTNGQWYTHVEGYENNIEFRELSDDTTNSGYNTHAEGMYNRCSGQASHVQNLGNISNAKAQTVLGRYNVEDKSGTAQNLYGTYAVIVGNGTEQPWNVYDSTHTYNVGDNVLYEGSPYSCIRQTTGDFNSNDWAPLSDMEFINNNRITRSNAATLTWDGYLNVSGGFSVNGVAIQPGGNGDIANPNISDAYSNSATYDVGDYCIYQDTLYKCNTPITAEAWTAAHWTATTIGAELLSIISRMSALETALNGYSFADVMTQAEYDQITPDEDTVYPIVG